MKSLQNLMCLKNRVAIITGGSGHLGYVIAETLAELGCSLCLVDKSGTQLNKTCKKISQTWNVKALGFEVDLEDENARIKLYEEFRCNFERLDVLVNNAAFVGENNLSGWAVPFYEQSIDTWRRALEVNLTASFHLSQLFSPLLKINGKGSIINISSIYGVVAPDFKLYEGTPMNNPAAYSASKGGLIQITRWLSAFLAPEIRVNCISPGGIQRQQPKEFIERYVSKTPLGRMGNEEDLKGAIAFFATDLSSWVTGENLMVDGGWTVL